jgi:hypothetical protein
MRSISKLAIAGQQAGLTVEQMVRLLSDGLSVETLLDLIAWRLDPVHLLRSVPSLSNWVV